MLQNKAYGPPIAVLKVPTVLEYRLFVPSAILLAPVWLEHKVLYPIAILLNPVVFLLKDPLPAAKLCTPVLEELKFVVAPMDMFEETFPPPLLKNKPLIVPFEPDVEIDPVTPNDPVIWADPVNGKDDPPALGAHEADTANEAVPNNEPVNDVAVKAPVMSTVFAAKSPFINGVPELEAMYNLLLSSVNVEGPDPNPIAILFEELPEKFNPAFCPNAILFDPDVL